MTTAPQVVALLSASLPWPVRRRVLTTVLGYKIHPTARIGRSLIAPRHLIMEEGSYIGDFNVCRGLDLLWLGKHASIGRGNWISGFPSDHSGHYSHRTDRRPELVVHEHAAITNRHLVDCTDSVTIGRFSTLAGNRSQILTHSIDLKASRQSCAPIAIGDYTFIGTDCVLLGGSSLPSYSVLSAKSLLNRAHAEGYALYGGVPAAFKKQLTKDYKYFTRTRGFVT